MSNVFHWDELEIIRKDAEILFNGKQKPDKKKVEEFRDYLTSVERRIVGMLQTLRSVAELIRLETIPYVPLDTSALEQSFEHDEIYTGDRIMMMVGYDAVDEDTGFHYAYYQHENRLHHPKRGVDHYLTLGIMDSRFEVFELIEKDYLSLFSGNVMSSTTGSRNMRKTDFAFVNRRI